jgi:regulator of cell morphogenesis and NO signaling
MTITETTAVGEIAAAFPSSIRVFQRLDIDFCCGGQKPLAKACADRGLPFDEVVDEITASAIARQEAVTDWPATPLDALTAHIVRSYHEPLRAELPRLNAMAAKVAKVHGGKDARLGSIASTLSMLSDELQTHMRKEELMLFPIIEAVETGAPASMGLDAPISVMTHEHDRAGMLLAELRSLTDGYSAPQWGCATLRALYSGLSELEDTMHVHVHLENNILFPRALRLLQDA